MDFETTTCISIHDLDVLTATTMQYDMPLHSFIARLLIFAAKTDKGTAKAFTSIAYRKRDKQNPWQRVHLYLEYREYEYLLDIKKLWKMSVAKAIAYCVEHVLDEFVAFLNNCIEEERKGNTDNYLKYELTRSYLFEYDTEEGVHCCRFYWGLPLKYARTAPLHTRKTNI